MPKLRKLINTTLPVSLNILKISCITACHQRALLGDCSLLIFGDDASPMTDFWSETTRVNLPQIH